MVNIRLQLPDGVMSLIKYVMAEKRMKQNDVITTLLQIGEAAIPFADLPDAVEEVYRQTQIKLKEPPKEQETKGV